MVAPVVFSSGFKVAFVAIWKVSCGELWDCLTRCTNPRLVAKREQIVCMTSCEFNELAAKPKFVAQSRPALYSYSQRVEELETSAKLTVFVLNISSPLLKRRHTRYLAVFRAAQHIQFIFVVHVG